MALKPVRCAPPCAAEGIPFMGYPDWGGPGQPVYPGDPFTEGVNQYGTSGLYRSHGGRRILYENPNFPQWTGGHPPARSPSVVRSYQHLGYRTDYPAGQPVTPVESPSPRSPYDWGHPARTPVPSSDLVEVFDEPAGGLGQPQGQTRPASKKKRATARGGPPWRIVLLDGDRSIGY